MRWDESPRFLLIASVASAVLSAALGLAAIWDHPGYNVAAAGLALLTAILGHRAFERSTHRRLGRIQRTHSAHQSRGLRLLIWGALGVVVVGAVVLAGLLLRGL